MPSVRCRIRATPFQSGVAYASCRNTGGSRVTGKNVPEKRNIGVIDEAEERVESSSRSSHAENAETGAESASPSRIAAGHARIAYGEWIAPNAAMITR